MLNLRKGDSTEGSNPSLSAIGPILVHPLLLGLPTVDLEGYSVVLKLNRDKPRHDVVVQEQDYASRVNGWSVERIAGGTSGGLLPQASASSPPIRRT